MLDTLDPGYIGYVHQSVNSFINANKQAEIGDIFNLPLNRCTDGIFFSDHIPGIGNHLLYAQGYPAAFRLDIEHHRLDLFCH